MKFTVSANGNAVTGYEASLPTQFPGIPDGPFTCTLGPGVQAVYIEVPIFDREFEFSKSSGSFFKGRFDRLQTAVGTLQFVVGGGACRSGVLTWTATTTASPAGSEECKSAQTQVAQAQTQVKKAKKAIRKAKKGVKKAKKGVKKAKKAARRMGTPSAKKKFKKAQKKRTKAKTKLQQARTGLDGAGSRLRAACG